MRCTPAGSFRSVFECVSCHKIKKRRAGKPSSVYGRHLSGFPVSGKIISDLPADNRRGTYPLLNLAPDEVYPAAGVTVGPVSSYLAISPLPSFNGGIFSAALAVTVPETGAVPGRYPASSPAEPGLSSGITQRRPGPSLKVSAEPVRESTGGSGHTFLFHCLLKSSTSPGNALQIKNIKSVQI